MKSEIVSPSSNIQKKNSKRKELQGYYHQSTNTFNAGVSGNENVNT
jgi:hypothetical protein